MNHRFLFSRLISFVIFLVALSPHFAFAAFLPGETLDPMCEPTDPTCVILPQTPTDITPTSDAALDIGSSTARFRDAYLSGTINADTASTTNVTTDTLSLGSLTGFLKASAGVVSNALVDLGSDVTGILPVGNGGTGLSTTIVGQLLVGGPGNTFTQVATSSLGLLTSDVAEGSNLYYTNNRVASVIAGTTTDALAQGTTNKYYSTLLFAGSLAGTTTDAVHEGLSNLYFSNNRLASALAATTTTALAEGSNLYYTNNRVASVIAGTTTDAIHEGLSNLYFSNNRLASALAATTTDALAEGTNNLYFTNTRAGNYINSSSSVPHIAGSAFGDILSWTGSSWGTRATSTLAVALSDTTGILAINHGGTNATSLTIGQPLSYDGTRFVSTSTLSVAYGGTGVSSLGQGWLFSSGGSASLSASTSPTVNYIVATSSTATSTFAGGVAVGGSGLKVGNLIGCTGLGTDGLGNIGCATVASSSVIARLSADQSTTTNIVLGNVTNLSFPIGANEVWVFRFDLIVTTTASPGIQVAVTAPSGATCNYAASSVATGGAAGTSVCGAALAITSGETNASLPVVGAISNGGTAGVVHLQFAQNVSSAQTTTVLQGSSLSAFRTSSGADLGEVYYATDTTLLPGTVVALDASLQGGVRRAVAGDAAIGIVSTKPGMVLGDDSGSHEGVPVIVALAGRVPVQVSTENGAISPGDYLTPSSQAGVAMKAVGFGPVVGQAMTPYDGEGLGTVVAFVKNFDLSQSAALLGTISTSSLLASAIQSETPHDPLSVIAQKVSDGVQLLTDFVAARVTAIRGYFDEVYARRVHTEQICLKKSDGTETCLNGDQLQELQDAQGDATAPTPQPSPAILPDQSATTSSETDTAQGDATQGTASSTNPAPDQADQPSDAPTSDPSSDPPVPPEVTP